MALVDMIPGMTDADLKTLRANAERLVEHGAPAQQAAAAEILPVIAAETATRAAAAPAKKTPVRKAAAKPRAKKVVAEAATA
jgi:hypothetical protein